MSKENRKPIFTESISLEFTKGVYSWYCKTVLTLYTMVIAILNQAKKVYTAAEYTVMVHALWIVPFL